MKLLDISEEFIVYPFGNAVKLIAPDSPMIPLSHNFFTVKKIMQFPFNVAFSNTDVCIQKINEQTVATLGFESPFKAQGDNIASRVKKECAKKVLNLNYAAMNSNQIIIDEGEIMRKDELPLDRLSFYRPWINQDHKIIGIFGYSVIIGMQSLAEFFTAIKDSGLLSQAQIPVQTSNLAKGITPWHFSKREKECIAYIIRGKTLKETANLLGLSKRTVEYYFEQIKIKLGVYSKSDAIEKLLNYPTH